MTWEYRHVTKEPGNKKIWERKIEVKHEGERTPEDRSMASLEKGKEYMTLSPKNGVCWRELNKEQYESRIVTSLKKENESVLAR